MEKALQKRIKRHVTGRTRDYFAITAPRLEALCLKELTALSSTIEDAAVEKGGVAFKGRLIDCQLANLHLRTANRVLLRIAEFKAPNFDRLEKNLSAISWELYLRPGTVPEMHVTARHSRLYHKGAVAERFVESIAKKIGDGTKHEPFLCNIFVRIADDTATVSVDSSGEILYKRGIKKQVGRAPLRENMAAASLMLAGYDSVEPIVDPMCGSGTFSLEAAMMAGNVPPGWFRNFSFMDWPSWKPESFLYEKRRCEEGFTNLKRPSVFASDKSAVSCRMLRETVKKHNLSGMVRVSERNFFDFSPSELTEKQGIVLLNPPYGLRMGTRRSSEKLLENMLGHLETEYKGWKFVLVVPEKYQLGKVRFRSKSHTFRHGGRKRTLLVGKI